MRTISLVRIALGASAGFLGLAVAPAAMASAAPPINVPCSGQQAALVAAINTANGSGGGAINLATGCTYTLNKYLIPPSPNGPNGLPVITTPITITGQNVTITRSSSASAFRLFEVDGPRGNLTLNGLALTGGESPFGGALLNVEGAVTLNSVRVLDNTAGNGGGGLASGVVDPTHLGPIGTLTLNSTIVSGNTAQGGGGGGILNHAGTTTLNNSIVSNNTSGGGGGGIASGPGNGGTAGSSTLALNQSQVTDNTSNGGPMAGAGGIANGGVATLTYSQVDGNSAPGASGGGILNHGTMTLTNSQVNTNTAPTDTNEDAGNGGGIANLNFAALGATSPSGVLTIQGNSQVQGNSASGVGGGILDVGLDAMGNPTQPAGTLTLSGAIITGNSAGVTGGGIFTVAASPITVKQTTINHNTPNNCSPSGAVPTCVG